MKPLSRPGARATVLDTFKVTFAARAAERNDVLRGTTGANRWLTMVRERIGCEILHIEAQSTFTKHYKRRQQHLDDKVSDLQRRSPQPTFGSILTKIGLSKHDRAIIKSNMQRPEDDTVISKFSIDFCVRDLRTLISPNWLNDEVINFYCQLLVERSESNRGKFPSLHAFSSFFFPKLRDRGYEGVKMATRRLNPPALARDLLLIPVHLGMHWCMAAIDIRSKSIAYYDSLHGRNLACLRALREWIKGEFAERQGGHQFDFAGWTELCPEDIPAQHNGHDCGVFALAFAEHLSRDAPFTFSQDDMSYWRDRISFEIIKGNLLEY